MQTGDQHLDPSMDHNPMDVRSHSRGIQLAEHAQAILNAGKLHPVALVTPFYCIGAII